MARLKLSIYDFDGTIYNGDSAIDFWFFILSEKPLQALLVPYQLFVLFLHSIKIFTIEKVKETFFLFIKKLEIKDLEILVEEFWKNNINKINSWFYDRCSEEKESLHKIVCISASPDFLLDYIAEKIGFDKLICTKFVKFENKQSNKIIGLNCKGDEKVRRLKQWLEEEKISDYSIERFYSDSFSDMPLFNLAINKYMIKKGKIVKLN